MNTIIRIELSSLATDPFILEMRKWPFWYKNSEPRILAIGLVDDI